MRKKYLRISAELSPGSPEWYAKRAIEAHNLPQSAIARKTLGAIFGALGAAIEGEPPETVESLIREGQSLLDSWAILARDHCKSVEPSTSPGPITPSVQNTPAIPITEVTADNLDIEYDFEDDDL